jgi:hypothetical protein
MSIDEEQLESFITDCTNSAGLPPEKIVDLTNQLFEISKSESVPLEQVPSFIKQKLEEKQKLDDQIKDADALLQSKNVTIEAVNEHIHLRDELNNHGLSTHDTYKLVNLLVNAKHYGFESKKIVAKLSSIPPLENKEKRLRNNCAILANQIDRYKEIIPLAEQTAVMRISVDELTAFKIAITEASQTYDLPISSAAYRVINDIKDYNKLGGLKRELQTLYLQIFVMNQFSAAMMALVKLQSCGVTEDQIFNLCRRFQMAITANSETPEQYVSTASEVIFRKALFYYSSLARWIYIMKKERNRN